ncbi:hypothetical protein DQ04_04141070 [Trypanosoma grayi]|uniref:hypothetical protein n=1 Tax=Trypanosoma grayi TaxID=71804 RepID=UPI0004F49387|nr:hypothetical protein DQ04_04141070 [Trypanosoma grayi]KEG10130.1 hypothetical protein DQ04_04141070 [Trypanosoma grayi]
MAAAVLPAEFRCFRHITHVYARNLPLRAADADDDVDDGGGPLPVLPLQEQGQKPTPPASRRGSRTPVLQRCVSSYFVLSHTPGRIYASEVRRDTQHPVWSHIPPAVTQRFASLTQFVFSLYYCTTHPEEALPAPETDFLLYEMLMQTSNVQYLASSMTKADALPSLPCHADSGANSFVVLLRCADGVFFPMHQGVQVNEGGVVIDSAGKHFLHKSVSAVPAAATNTSANNSTISAAPVVVLPSGSLQPDAHLDTKGLQGKGTLAGVENMTMGDLKTCATAALAWHYLSDLAAARREEQQALIDGVVEVRRGETEVAAQRAILEAQLRKVRERLHHQMHDLDAVRDRYIEEQQKLAEQQAQVSVLQESIHHGDAQQQETRAESAEQELSLAALRVQLEKSRKLRMTELRALFPVVVGAAGAADTICGHSLPVRGRGLGVTVGELHDWSLALGCAARLVSTAATVYGCTLPHPLLLCGARSCVLARPGLPVATVVAPYTGPGDVKLPLYCTRATDRPLMTVAMQLLLADVVILAKAMGRSDTASDAAECDGRLGPILNQLLLLA